MGRLAEFCAAVRAEARSPCHLGSAVTTVLNRDIFERFIFHDNWSSAGQHFDHFLFPLRLETCGSLGLLECHQLSEQGKFLVADTHIELEDATLFTNGNMFADHDSPSSMRYALQIL